MSEPGNDCPRCGARLGASGCLSCYWQPTAAAEASTSCAGCIAERKDSKRWCVNLCRRCGDHSPSVTEFHPDDPETKPEDRGERLCPSCWIPALKRRADGVTRAPKCPEPECGLTVGDHIDECKRIASSVTWELKFGGRRDPEPAR